MQRFLHDSIYTSALHKNSYLHIAKGNPSLQYEYVMKNIMAQINPYIHFNGNAEEAFTFYKAAFGGEFSAIARFKDFPNPESPIKAEEADNIMHIALPIGQNSMLMGSDTPAFMGKQNENENRSKIYVRAENKEEGIHLFQALSAGGQIEMPFEKSPWGSFFGMFRDKYGIEWMIDTNS